MGETFFGREVATSFLKEHFPEHAGVRVGRSTVDFLAYGCTGQFLQVVRYIPARGSYSATLDTIVAPDRRLRYHDRHPDSGLGWNPYNSMQDPSALEMAGIAVAALLDIPANPATEEINNLVFGALNRIQSELEDGLGALQALRRSK
ncbi:MAG: hypothetical protein Q7T41_00560 [Candidatus Saccharibacteria bacterium]|nr:hypothetical protein [Candidatus Saccharibacteria bacterium]